MTELLKVDNLALLRGDRQLCTGLSFALNKSEALIVRGPNGSGKTTLLRAVAGLLEPEHGRIEWRSKPVSRDPQAFRSRLGWFSHRPGFKGDLSIEENFRIESGLRTLDLSRLHDVLQRTGISRCRALPFRVLSAGQQRRAALARLVLSAAEFWLMDEPLTNLDTDGQALVTELIDEHLASGGACLLASHHAVVLNAKAARIDLG